MSREPRVEIQYCPRCRWLLRAAWLAQELLTTFEGELGEVALVPGASGEFDVYLAGQLLFSRRVAGRFPEAKELKQLLRDRIAPGRSLGHSDRSTAPTLAESERADEAVQPGESGQVPSPPDLANSEAVRGSTPTASDPESDEFCPV